MARIWKADTPVSQLGERGLLEAIAPHMAPAGGQIGRASCREKL